MKNAGVPQLQRLITQRRAAAGMSRRQLADEAAVYALDPDNPITEYEIRRLEQCQRLPPPEVLAPVCKTLGVERDLVIEILGLEW